MKQKFGYVGMVEEEFKLFYDLKTHTWKRPEDVIILYVLFIIIFAVCALQRNICEDTMKYQKEQYLF